MGDASLIPSRMRLLLYPERVEYAMRKHEHFDLWLHTDDELAAILGTKVAAREQLRAWPLSVVERISLHDGTSAVYKVFRGLPIETEVYRHVCAPFIPKALYNHSEGEQQWLLLEAVEGRHPSSLNIDELHELGGHVRALLNGLDAPFPLRYDLSEPGFESYRHSLVALLRKLRSAGKLNNFDASAITRVDDALRHPDVVETTRSRCGVLHGDLKCDNILIRPNGKLTIIDWQNMLYGPETIDVCGLIATQGIDPVPRLSIGPELLRLALEISWFASCLDRWMPDAGFLEGLIINIEKHMHHLAKRGSYEGLGLYYFH